jgi:two-component system sensor histidine kinase/response regulator
MNQPPHEQSPGATPAADTFGASPDRLPTDLPGFDLEAGLRRLQGNRALYVKLLARFADSYSGIADEIKQAIDDGDRQQTHALVHNLKGLAGNLSASTLFAAARDLDLAVKSESTDLQRLDVEFAALQAALDEALASARSVPTDRIGAHQSAAEALSSTQLLQLASRIREAVDMGDVMRIQETATSLAANSALSERICALADEFDFDGLLYLADEMEQGANR